MSVSNSSVGLYDFIESDKQYWWFDRLYQRVESASWMERQLDRTNNVAYVQGSKIPFCWLRPFADTAFQDGIDFHRSQIFSHEVAILKLESERESCAIKASAQSDAEAIQREQSTNK